MNSLANSATTNNETGYRITYANATWIEANVTIGIFASVNIGDQDSIVSSDFKKGSTGNDTLTIMIERKTSNEDVVVPFAVYPVNPGKNAESLTSAGVEVTLVDSATHETLWGPVAYTYGLNIYRLPEPEPIEMTYQFSYLSAPYRLFSENKREVFLIINTIVYENDVIEEVFTPSEEETFDTFNLSITSDKEGELKSLCQVFGPYVITNPESRGVRAGSTVNNKPAQKPVGIKSYGDDKLLTA